MERSPLYLFIILGFALCFNSCKDDSHTSTQEGTIHIRKIKDPQKLNPFIFPKPYARDVFQYIFPQLADFHPVTLDLIPVLIKDIPNKIPILKGPNKGGVKFSIEFLPEAKWDNGKDVTGHDYLFSIKLAKNPKIKAGGYRSHLQYIAEVNVDAINPKKFEVVFSKDYILAKETAITIEVYPAHIYDPKGLLSSISMKDIANEETVNDLIQQDSSLLKFAENINGQKYSREIVNNCGPYKLQEWVSNEYVILERKENYWGADFDNPFLQAGPKRIIFDIIPDETTAITQLDEGGIDLMTEVTGAAYGNLRKKEGDLQFFTPQLTKYYMIAMNNDSPELRDKNVRKALAHMVDVDNIMESIDFGNGNRTVGPIHPGKSYYNKGLQPLEYNVDIAKEILANSGWKDTNNDGIIDKKIEGTQTELELDIYVSNGKLGQQIALLMQEATAKAGVKINIIQKPYSEIESQHLKKKDFDMVPQMVRQELVLDDPYTRWHSDQTKPGGRNIYGLENEELDKILLEVRVENNPVVRDKLYKRVQKILYEEQPVIFLYAPSERIVVSGKWNATATVRRPGYMANTFTLK